MAGLVLSEWQVPIRSRNSGSCDICPCKTEPRAGGEASEGG